MNSDQTKSIPIEIECEDSSSGGGISEILEEHSVWLDSKGETGIQGDFSGLHLEGADLIDARLRHAKFNRTNLSRADLMLADMRGTSLLQANLQDANLLGTQFQEANLQAAALKGATGLVNTQFARANLFGAILPETVSPLDGLKHVQQMARRSGWLLGLMLALQSLLWLRIFTTRDTPLVKNGPALPFFGLQADLPFVPFYLFGPVILLVLYVSFHLYVQRLWDGASQLPAIFQDGRSLGQCLPWFARWPGHNHCIWLKKARAPLACFEAGIAIFLLFYVTPITIVLFWGRYLTLQDLRGSTVHSLLAGGSVLAAMSFPKMAAKSFGAEAAKPEREKRSARSMFARIEFIVPAAVAFCLFLLSIGTIDGVPHDYKQVNGSGSSRITTWGPRALWLAGYDPFPQLTEAEASTKPAAWTGRDEELFQIKGANLNRASLRYVQGYGVFLARARLWRADLSHAYLADSDLREANLRLANLQFAILDGAKLRSAKMQQADFSGANLDRCDLTSANLSSALLPGSSFLDATLTGANLYKADLSNALLQRANLKQADLRETNLENADLIAANLQDAYLTSARLNHARLNNSDLTRAILSDAGFSNSDLRGANLQEAVLLGADLTGANLQGADLRRVSGLSWNQVCSAASIAGVQLDENLRLDLQVQCMNHR